MSDITAVENVIRRKNGLSPTAVEADLSLVQQLLIVFRLFDFFQEVEYVAKNR